MSKTNQHIGVIIVYLPNNNYLKYSPK